MNGATDAGRSPHAKGQPMDSLPPKPPSGGPLNVAPHAHRDRWYLCDRSYVRGKRRHYIRGHFGAHRPTLYAPEIRAGRAEEVLPGLDAESFDLIYLDPPYGTTAAGWDRAPEWVWLGRETGRLLKPTGQVVLHGAGTMAVTAAAAFMESLAHRFEFVWVKARPDGPVRSTPWVGDHQPLRAHEIVHVFKRRDAKTSALTFNLAAIHRRGAPYRSVKHGGPSFHRKSYYGGVYGSDGWRSPVDVIFAEPRRDGDLFAAKPEELSALLIATLTNPGDLILDPYAGSGTTLQAAYRLGRRSLGVESNPAVWPLLQRNTGGLRGMREVPS